jgi:hypothetical protein
VLKAAGWYLALPGVGRDRIAVRWVHSDLCNYIEKLIHLLNHAEVETLDGSKEQKGPRVTQAGGQAPTMPW